VKTCSEELNFEEMKSNLKMITLRSPNFDVSCAIAAQNSKAVLQNLQGENSTGRVDF
jgi:hypothetical protein